MGHRCATLAGLALALLAGPAFADIVADCSQSADLTLQYTACDAVLHDVGSSDDQQRMARVNIGLFHCSRGNAGEARSQFGFAPGATQDLMRAAGAYGGASDGNLTAGDSGAAFEAWIGAGCPH